VKIANYQDFFAGLFFILFGALAAYLSTSYNMGTGARMGPGYFPYWLGIILAGIGVIVFIKAFGKTGGEKTSGLMRPIIIFAAMMMFSLAAGYAGASPNASLAIGTIAGCVLAFVIGMPSMALILGSITVFGLMLKSLGLVVCVTMLVIIASLASHERKTKEVIGSIVLLCAASVGIFVYGLKLQMPVWPDMEELQRQFKTDAKKK
jgi:Tripartite tricarboxylate transporter TctB family